jgi:predicted nucleotidyltransferase
VSQGDAAVTAAERLAERLAEELAAILGDDLLGVYLHGSVAMGCFNPDRSDIDLLVVTREALSLARRRSVVALMLARSGVPYPIEMTLMTADQVRPWRHPAPFEFHYSEMWRKPLAEQLAHGQLVEAQSGGMPMTDPDLAAHITTLRARGRALLGEPIQAIFPEVPDEDFREAILADLGSVHPDSQIYSVLNACRVLAYLDGNGVLSKAEAADWALGRLPAAHQETVAKAHSAYRRGAAEPCSSQEARQFVQWVAARAAEAMRAG